MDMEKNGNNEHDAHNSLPKSGSNSLNITPGQHPDDEFYDMSHPNRGMALIFNHQYFDNGYFSPRRGTEKDRDALGAVLRKLKFDVKVYDDLTRTEILDVLKIVSKMDHSKNDCLVVAVMTHGKSHGRIFARDNGYTMNELMGYFSGDNCSTLAGKPKLFFIQACRGENTDSGTTIKHESDSPKKNQIVYTIPAMADILIMYATVEGYYAWRDSQKGTCFIQALAGQLEQNHQKRDLLSILTLVNRQVAIGFKSVARHEDFNDKKEMCSIVSMLTRRLQFT